MSITREQELDKLLQKKQMQYDALGEQLENTKCKDPIWDSIVSRKNILSVDINTLKHKLENVRHGKPELGEGLAEFELLTNQN